MNRTRRPPLTPRGAIARSGPLVVAIALLATACSEQPDPRRSNFRVEKPGVAAQYDEKTGRLKKLEVDTDKDGRVDSWTYTDGTQIHRIEIDANQDGVIERWEYYVNNKLDRVGSSRKGDGIPDEFAYRAASGELARVEIDIDRDGRIDQWESYDPPATPNGPPVLRSVAMDPDATGNPTRRLLYKPNGTLERAERLR